MSQTYSYVSSSTASNNSSSDGGKKDIVFLNDIGNEYKAAFDDYCPVSPARLDSARMAEEWRKRIVRAHMLECLVLQNIKRTGKKVCVTQYYGQTRSLDLHGVSSAQFCRMVVHWKKKFATEILEEAERRIQEEELSETAQTIDGPEKDGEEQAQLRELRSEALMNSPRAQKEHFTRLLKKASLSGRSGGEAVEVVKRNMFKDCKVILQLRFNIGEPLYRK